MTESNANTRTVALMLALVAVIEIFRPATAMTQRSTNDYMRDLVSELRGIRQELAGIRRKLK